MSDFDLEKTGQDLKNKDTRTHTAAQIGGAVIGGMVGGYQGMMIGMSIAGYLFKPSSPNKKDDNNPDYAISNARIDSVPDVIGTDMCPGKVIYFNKDTFEVFDSGHLSFSEDDDDCSMVVWSAFINALSENKIAYWAEFAVNFVGNYTAEHHVGVMKFNGKPFWFWTMLSDVWENYKNALSPCQSLTIIDAAKIEYYQNINIEELIGQPWLSNNIMYFKGFFADFTASAVSPDTSQMFLNLSLITDIKPELLPAKISAMPIFTAEVNSDRVWMSPESMHGGVGIPSYTSYRSYDESIEVDYYNFSISMSKYWGCRDAKNNFFVGVTSAGCPIIMEGSDRKWWYAGSDVDLTGITYLPDIELETRTWMIENISPEKRPEYLQATDIGGDRVYICGHRNWYNGGTSNHHHANYGIELDLFYFDRSDPEYKVHSVIYNTQINCNDYWNVNSSELNYNPAIKFRSMVVGGDYVYLFGGKIQTDITIRDYRTIGEGSTHSMIYGDFSAYDHPFWVSKWVSLQQFSYRAWTQIVKQTDTYISVWPPFPDLPIAGQTMQFCKFPRFTTGWIISPEDTDVFESIPDFYDLYMNDWGENDLWIAVFFPLYFEYNDHVYYTPDYMELWNELLHRPQQIEVEVCCNPGKEKCELSGDGCSPHMSEYIGTMISLGFSPLEPKSDLDNLCASRIEGNEFIFGEHICLRVNKNTGVIDLFDSKRVIHPSYYVGPNLTWAASPLTVWACATDVTAFVYSHECEYGTKVAVYSYVIEFDGSNIIEPLHRRNNYSGGHAPAWCYMGAVPVKEWDEDAKEYVNVWYTVLKCFDSAVPAAGLWLIDTIGQGTHLLRLNDGRFSNQQDIFSPLDRYLGLDLGDNIDQILFRKTVSTGPLYVDTYLKNFPDENTYSIGKFGITEDIYFTVLKVPGMAGTGIGSISEMWRYTPPTEADPAGELYCIGKSALSDFDTNLNFQWSKIPSYGSFIQCRYGFYGTYESGRWYHCDESPAEIICGDGWSNNPGIWRIYFGHNYATESMTILRDEAVDICNEIIDTTLYTVKENINLKERRFQFSQCYDQPKKFQDVINEILQTCQGFISTCIWGDYRYKMIVPNPDEKPVYYFGYDSAVFVSTQESGEGELDLIYGDFAAYPDNYWKGDMVHYIEPKYHGYREGYKNWDIVIEQTSTYIKVGYGSGGFPESEQFTLKKDNIKEGSFTFAEKSVMDRPNKVRIEFKNRLLGYIKDVAEAEDAYRLDVLGEPEKIDHYKMHGIKRATQAGRMAQRILDQWNHQRYICAFETDVMGMALCMGEIIGVSHPITGWNGKWFRIVAMEELMDFEVKLELEEFNPYCYHDNGVPVMQGYSHSGFPTPYIPRNVERLEVKEDIEFNRLYFTFKKPSRDAGFFIGGRVYRQTGDNTWDFVAVINETVSSVKLAQSVGINDTTIYYDNDSLYGSFPSQGVIWVENELMYYHGIDTINHAFTHVVRGYRDTNQVEHSLDNGNIYITLKDDSLSYLEIDLSWAGTTQTFKVSATTIHGLTISLDISPTIAINVVGYGVLPYFPESIQNKLPEFENLFESLGLSDDLTELTIEEILEVLGLGDSKVVTETLTFLIESIGLGDDLREMSLIQIIETLGLGDVKYQPDYVRIIEALGLGDSDAIAEALAQLIESIGLGDDEYDPDA